MNRVQRYDGCFSFFFIDLDYFKKLNDTYGHQAGDLTPKVVADILQNMKRNEDKACRDGGEELVLILPETEKMNALVIAERIRKKVEEAGLEFEGKTFNVTLSGGIASYPGDGKEAHELVHAADVALYQAKESGRNRIFLHDLEKRHYLRIGISEEVQVQSVAENLNPKELNAQGKNVSSSGILFESPVAFKIGSQVQIALSIKGQADPLTVNAQVARVESFDSYFDIGVAFLDMNDAGESEFSKTLLQHLGIT